MASPDRAGLEAHDRRVRATAQVIRGVFARSVGHFRAQAGERRLTQRRLGVRMGVSRETLTAIETGRTPLTEASLARLLVALDLKLVDFLVVAAWQAMERDERLVSLLGRGAAVRDG